MENFNILGQPTHVQLNVYGYILSPIEDPPMLSYGPRNIKKCRY